MLTNTCALKVGDELILRKAEQKAPDKESTEDWKTSIAKREQEHKATAATKAKAKAKGK